MSVITRILGQKSLIVYTKGAPEIIAGMCVQESIPPHFQQMLSVYTERGYRVIALATKVLNANFAKVIRSANYFLIIQLHKPYRAIHLFLFTTVT